MANKAHIILSFLALIGYKFFFASAATQNSFLRLREFDRMRNCSQIKGQTWIVATDDSFTEVSYIGKLIYELHENVNPTVLMVNQFLHQRNASYFNREFRDDEIFNSCHLEVKHTPWSFMALVFPATPNYHANIELTNSLISNKVLRPQVDYFIQISSATGVQELARKEYSRRFGFQSYIVAQDGRIVNFVPSGHKNLLKPSLNLLSGRIVTAAITSFPEKIRFHSKSEDGRLLEGEGVYYEILKTCGQYFNFTFNVVPGGGTGGTGRRLRSGDWNGAVGDVLNRRVDFGIMIGSSFSRDRVVDYTTNLDLYTRIFYIRQPSMTFNWKSIYLPFTSFLWMAVLVTAIFFLQILFLNTKFENYKLPVVRRKVGYVARIILDVLKVLLDQGTSLGDEPHSRTRVIVIMLSAFGLLIGTAYRSMLMSSLTKPSQSTSFPKTHLELAVSDYTLYFRYYGGVIYQYFANSKETVHQIIFSRMLLVNSSAECVILTLLNDQSACLDYEPAGDYAISSNTSVSTGENRVLFVKSEDTDLSVGVTWAFPKGSPLMQYFNQLFLHLIAVGLKEQWMIWDEERNKVQSTRWMKQQKDTELMEIVEKYNMDEVIKGLPLKVFYGVAFIYFALNLLAGICCLAENNKLMCKKKSKADVTN